MANKGWFNLEAAGGAIPETQYFEGDSAFKFLGLTRTQRLYGFIGWYEWFRFLCLRVLVYVYRHSLAAGFLFSIIGAIVLFVGLTALFASTRVLICESYHCILIVL